ncbi:phosducin-like protein [Heterostelium album PN500]|uniref:Phosducin-like protein n=1 Tax=Heterostelium pallidum (strain ATCC 26659 / Pp 5 / PN500) TaxID=670386 RepID=D3BUZ0_HETP5|nr:phosducin-like protein [Heterostelium album PN500]EFA74928.1 phosducin-like protein [Heterostelium album PN500]|eukprot:XP_020427062.1 phosducin-like protein [Heterostelium album PN500]
MSGETEWDDIQIKLGNKAAPPKKLTEDEIFDLIQEAAQYASEKEKQEKLDNASLEDLKEMEDDEDEQVLEKLRQRRIAQMKAEAEKNKFGELYEISEPAYKSEVTETTGYFVVVLLFKNGIPQCQLVNEILKELAKKHRATKFVRIRSEEAIHNYPDRNLPTILVYFNGMIVNQMITLAKMYGDQVNAKDIEWWLSRCGAVKTEMKEDPRTAKKTNITTTSKSLNSNRARIEDSDDDYSDDD